MVLITDRRQLMVQLWYPATPKPNDERIQYLEHGAILAPVAQLLKMSGFTVTHRKYVRTHAVSAAPMAQNDGPYPVVIFSHGRGGFRQHNMFQIEDIVTLEHGHPSFSHFN